MGFNGCQTVRHGDVEIVVLGDGAGSEERIEEVDHNVLSLENSVVSAEETGLLRTGEETSSEASGSEKAKRAAPQPSKRRGWWPLWGRGEEPQSAGDVSSPGAAAPEPGDEEREKALAEQLSAEQPTEWFAPDGSPYLRPGFSIKVSVIAGGIVEVPEMIRIVSDKSTITLPLVGRIECHNMTIRTLVDRLTEEYSRFLKEPNVSVDYVYEGRAGEVSPWGWVSVYGAVNSPGRINIPPSRDLSLSRAIQFAGGLNRVARETDIRIWRRTSEGPKKIVINLLDIAKRGIIEKDLKLEPGDIIFVPESVW